MRLITKIFIYLVTVAIVTFLAVVLLPLEAFYAVAGFIQGVWVTHLYYCTCKKN